MNKVIILVTLMITLLSCSSEEKKVSISKEIREESYLLDLALDIKLNNPEGKMMSLSDLRGKIVLVDFWASWCVPCRKEASQIVQLYKKYRGDNFEIFSVSLDGLDNQENPREDWVKAIKEDQFSWDYHVSDLKGWDTRAFMGYEVESIPAKFLIAENGSIILSNASLMDIKSYLGNYFDKGK